MSSNKFTLNKEINYLTKSEQKEVQRAWKFASKAHDGQMRKSGDPYIVHLEAVAEELARMRMDDHCVIAGLLHDVPEDTEYTLQDVTSEFGEEVAKLVDAVTKLGKVRLRTKEEQQARNLRKMFLAMSDDVRVIIIKLADRLHNMKTIKYLPRNKQKGIATETLEIYSPLAHRLGMGEIRIQLEDLCLKCLHPHIYKSIEKEVRQSRSNREHKVEELIDYLEQELAEANIIARVRGRSKHLYSIYRNVFVLHKEERVADVLDSLGLRVIVQDVKDCYQTLGLVHRLWRPIIGRFKDYIAIPKANGYQSLHTGVITDEGDKLEIQIRTEEMDFLAEYGMAAHWRYKDKSLEFEKDVEDRMNWIQQLLDWQKEFRTALDFVESLKLDLFEDQIFVMTPKGDVKDLPLGATPIDFAYSVHSELGHRCIGAKVNNRMVPLDYHLQSGDIVEILATRKARGPSRDWLEFVKTGTAKQKIRAWLKKQQYGDNVTSGKKKINESLTRIQKVTLEDLDEAKISQVAQGLNFRQVDDMWAAVGYGELGLWRVLRKLTEDMKEPIGGNFSLKKSKKRGKTQSVIKGVGELLVKMAPCCQPLPGDKIVGYITRGKGITVHRAVCQNVVAARKKEPERITELEWEKQIVAEEEIGLSIKARDRTGLVRDITEIMAARAIQISSLEVSTEARTGKAKVELYIKGIKMEQLGAFMQAMERIPDVLSVERLRR